MRIFVFLGLLVLRGVVMFLLVACTGCTALEGIVPRVTGNSILRGAELSVLCSGEVRDVLYVDVIAGGHRESFGVIGANPNAKEGGKTVGFFSINIDTGMTVQWGIEGEDGIRQEHFTHFDLSAYSDRLDNVKAVVLYYSRNGMWEFRAYDKCVSEQDKALLFAIRPKKD